MNESPSPDSGFRALRNADVTISKIGGENATKLRANADSIRARTAEGKKQIYTISALRSGNPYYEQRYAHLAAEERDGNGAKKTGFNTTSHLIAVAKFLCAGDGDSAFDLLERVRNFTKEVVQTEISQDPDVEQSEATAALHTTIDRVLNAAADRLRSAKAKPIALDKDWILQDPHGTFSITGIGEELAKAIYHTYFGLKGIAVGGLSTEGFTDAVLHDNPQALIENDRRTEQAVSLLRENIRVQLDALMCHHQVIVAGGYLPVLASERNYSDMSAALIAQAAKAAGVSVLYLKEGDTPVMSANPKMIPDTRVIHNMTPEFAMEAFGNKRGANGGAIHAKAIRMLAEHDLDAVVYNPEEDPDLNRITHIHRFDPPPNGVEMVASRQMPVAVEVQSIRMLGRSGFMHAMTEWFASRGISIDQISTSEVTVSLTFSNGDLPDALIQDFQTFLRDEMGLGSDLQLTVTQAKSLLFCLGNNMKKPGVARDATAALADAEADIHFIAQGLNERVMTFMVDADKAPAALARLHKICIERKP